MFAMNREVVELSKHIDSIMDQLINKYRLPSDIAVEVLSFSLFKSIYRLRKNKVHSKESLEMFTRGILNKHFMNAGLDLLVQRVEWPQPPPSSRAN